MKGPTTERTENTEERFAAEGAEESKVGISEVLTQERRDEEPSHKRHNTQSGSDLTTEYTEYTEVGSGAHLRRRS